MPTPYLLVALSLALSDPLALLAETLVMLAYLHLAGAGGYLVFRALGFQWDGIDAGWRVMCAVHELRQARAIWRIGWAAGVVVLLVAMEL